MSAIGSAKQDGNSVIVYDENGNYKFQKDGTELIGYTSSTVTVKDSVGASITYGSDGEFKYQR
jgi:hypothetical protein